MFEVGSLDVGTDGGKDFRRFCSICSRNAQSASGIFGEGCKGIVSGVEVLGPVHFDADGLCVVKAPDERIIIGQTLHVFIVKDDVWKYILHLGDFPSALVKTLPLRHVFEGDAVACAVFHVDFLLLVVDVHPEYQAT